MRPVIALRRLVFWVLLLAVPIQAAAAPGWLCATAGHHASVTRQHVHPIAEGSGVTTHVEDATSHSHEAAGLPGQASDEESAPQLPGVGTCSACSGCCFTALAVPLSASSSPLAETVHQVAAYVSPAVAVPAGDGPFRPPRALTL